MSQGMKRRIILAIPVVLLFYISFAAEPLGREFFLTPVWKYDIFQETGTDHDYQSVNSGRSDDTAPIDTAVPYHIGNHYGFLSASGRLLGSGEDGSELAITFEGFALPLGQIGRIEFTKPNGKDRKLIEKAGFPFFIGNRKFVMRPDQAGICEYNNKGIILWELEFPSIITCLASNDLLLVVGLLNGAIQVIHNDGSLVMEHATDGSRISAVYGVAISENSRRIAIISGLDRQTVSIFELQNKVYRKIFNLPLYPELRRQIPCTFVADGKLLAFERDGGLALLDVDTGRLDFRPTGTQISPFIMVRGSQIAFYAARTKSSVRIIGVGAHGRIDVALAAAGRNVAVQSHSNSIYLTVDSMIVRLDMEIQ
ncbi:MAG: hypothetical protein Q8O19_06590 [Rectinemataceae bacterium]|nr:hypothetical protein [Rectinemataceae bacterium]